MADYETELISIVAHDLKSPIVAVKGFLQLVEISGELTEQQIHFLGRAVSTLDRMEHIISGLLDLTRLEADGLVLDIAQVNLVSLINEAIHMLEEIASENSITIHFEASEGVFVPADADLLRHVIVNLLTNAIKYNRENGDVFIRIVDQNRVIRVDVQDTGIGIRENELSKVFEKFFRSSMLSPEQRRSGSGLGLSICKSIVELHGGNIWVESEVDKGSTFCFTLPLENHDAPSGERRAGITSHEMSSEILDGVDDNTQESADWADSESTDDAP